MNIKVTSMSKTHWPEVRRIYQAGIDTGLATFETIAPDWPRFDIKFLHTCRLVATEDKQIRGWAALQSVSDRKVYKGVAEVTVYVDPLYHHQGIGKVLLQALIEASERNRIWMLTASIFEMNIASIKLHEKLGFEVIGKRKSIAKRNGKWITTVMMDRRSEVVGV